MAMQKNRNLFQLSLIWMFIFVCLQCLVVKCRPSGTTKTLPVKSAINPTVDSQFEKDNGTLDVSNENINVPSIDNKTSNGKINKTTNKMIGTTNTTVSPRSQTTTTTAPASPKNLTGSAGQKLPHKSTTAKKPGETTVLVEDEDELTTKNLKDKNDVTTPTTTKKTGESKDKNDVTTPTTTKKNGESKDKNDATTPTTTKKTGESKDKNEVTTPTTTKKTGESKDKNDVTPPTTTKKTGESIKNKNDENTPTTTKKNGESKDKNDVTPPTTTKKNGESKDKIVLNESPTTKTSDAQQDENVVKEPLNGSKISLEAGKTNDRKNDENKKPLDSGTLYEDDEDTGGHFMAYFITFVVICIAGYIIYHNKQKILAFILEGKKDGSRRRPNSKEYKRLKTDEVMPSLEKNTSDNKYIY